MSWCNNNLSSLRKPTAPSLLSRLLAMLPRYPSSNTSTAQYKRNKELVRLMSSHFLSVVCHIFLWVLHRIIKDIQKHTMSYAASILSDFLSVVSAHTKLCWLRLPTRPCFAKQNVLNKSNYWKRKMWIRLGRSSNTETWYTVKHVVWVIRLNFLLHVSLSTLMLWACNGKHEQSAKAGSSRVVSYAWPVSQQGECGTNET